MSEEALGVKFTRWQRAAVMCEILLSHGRAKEFREALNTVDLLSMEVRSAGESLLKRIEDGKEGDKRKSETDTGRQEDPKQQPGNEAKSKRRKS